jgi:hypothetical protein
VAISPTQSQVLQALRGFLMSPSVLAPFNPSVVAAQQNRVAEPATPNFVVMTPIMSRRLETNIDSSADVRCVASINGTVMTVTSVTIGELAVGATVQGTGVLPGTTIANFATGSGAVGTYTVSPSQTTISQVMSAGSLVFQLNSEFTIQLDFHSPDLTTASDMAQTASTLIRDSFATSYFAALNPPFNQVAPLYADDPAQRPFINEAQQFEYRWVLDCHLQVNQVVSTPAPYADSLIATLEDVVVLYPET